MLRQRLWLFLLIMPFLIMHGSVLHDFSQYEDLDLFAFVNKYQHVYDLFFKFSPEYPTVYRPLTFAYYFGLLRFFGIEPLYARIFNAVLHGLCLIVFYNYCRRIFSHTGADSPYPYAACFFFLNQYVAYEAFLVTPCTGELLMFPSGFLFLSNHLDFLQTRNKISAAKGLAWLSLCLFAKESGIVFIFISLFHDALAHPSYRHFKMKWKYYFLLLFLMMCYLLIYLHMTIEGTMFHHPFPDVSKDVPLNIVYMARSFFGYPNEPYSLLKEKGYALVFYWINILRIISPALFITVLFYHVRQRSTKEIKMPFFFAGISLFFLAAAHLIGAGKHGILPSRHFFLPAAFFGIVISCLSAPAQKMSGTVKVLHILFLVVTASLSLTMLMIKEKEYQVVEEARHNVLRAVHEKVQSAKGIKNIIILTPPPIFGGIDRSIKNYLKLQGIPVEVQIVDTDLGQCKPCFYTESEIIAFSGVRFIMLSPKNLRKDTLYPRP